jgi:hypothetical protein
MSNSLYREVEIPCTLEEAWLQVTDPSWLGDHGEIDFFPGGEGWVSEGPTTRFLVVEEVENERRFTYRWASYIDAPSRVEIDLEPSSQGTRITIAETPMQAKAMASLSV